jgi:hypothetical protein
MQSIFYTTLGPPIYVIFHHLGPPVHAINILYHPWPTRLCNIPLPRPTLICNTPPVSPPIYIIMFALHLSSAQLSIISYCILPGWAHPSPWMIIFPQPIRQHQQYIYHWHTWAHPYPSEIIVLPAHPSSSRIYTTWAHGPLAHLIQDIM